MAHHLRKNLAVSYKMKYLPALGLSNVIDILLKRNENLYPEKDLYKYILSNFIWIKNGK